MRLCRNLFLSFSLRIPKEREAPAKARPTAVKADTPNKYTVNAMRKSRGRIAKTP